MMLKFFSINGNMGRLDYYKSSLVRGFISFLITFLTSIIVLLSTGQVTILEDKGLIFFLLTLFGVVLKAPIDYRRANDLRIEHGWIVAFQLLNLIPAGVGGFARIPLLIYTWSVCLILLFKPGQVHKEFVRSKNQGA